MQEISLPDCYGYAGLSPEAANISLRIEPFRAIATNLEQDSILELVRFYFGLPVKGNTDWFSGPIIEADPTFSMITNKRELAIIAMALLAQEVAQNENQFAALAILVASFCGKRKPAIYPQFVEIVVAAAKDLMVAHRKKHQIKRISVRKVSEELGGAEGNLVEANDFANLNVVLKDINNDSHRMDEFLAQQVSAALSPIHSEISNLREETDMLWWLVGGQSRTLEQPFCEMDEGKAAFLIGVELANMSQTELGPRASIFLMNKALREKRNEEPEMFKIESLPKSYSENELAKIAVALEARNVRDLCCLHNVLSRADELKSVSAWRKKFSEDGGVSEKTQLESSEIALQSFREMLLLNSYKN